VWKSSDIDVVPIPIFAVAAETGGLVLGAFHGEKLVGFTMGLAGWRDRKPFLHSHMTAVLQEYRDRGIGRRLKLFQRQCALDSGIGRIEWTFDPLITKNAYFNFMRLGAISRRYLPNVYGLTTSPLHAGLPTDRLLAQWQLRSPRVRRILAGKRATPSFSTKAMRITIPSVLEDLKNADPRAAARIQSKLRGDFLKCFDRGYAATAVAPSRTGVDYILEPWKAS
jgi:predicted GNAT superfamily acetyltransferase